MEKATKDNIPHNRPKPENNNEASRRKIIPGLQDGLILSNPIRRKLTSGTKFGYLTENLPSVKYT